jgi:T-complex protein 11/Methylmalonic aciduria and homocystinuria type D protein
MQADIADAHKSQLRTILSGSVGIDYERRAMAKQVGSAPAAEALPNTAAWLRTAHATVAATSSAAAARRTAASQVKDHVLQGLLDIAGSNVALSHATCPETLRLDLERLFALQNEAQRLALIAAVQVISVQLLRQQGASTAATPEHQAWLQSLHHRLSVCMGHDQVNLGSIVDEVVDLLGKRCSEQGVELSGDSRDLAAGMIRRTVSPDDNIWKFASKTLLAALKEALSGGDAEAVKARLAPVNGQLLADTVLQLAGVLRPVVDLNVQVHEPNYTAILQGVMNEV